MTYTDLLAITDSTRPGTFHTIKIERPMHTRKGVVDKITKTTVAQVRFYVKYDEIRTIKTQKTEELERKHKILASGSIMDKIKLEKNAEMAEKRKKNSHLTPYHTKEIKKYIISNSSKSIAQATTSEQKQEKKYASLTSFLQHSDTKEIYLHCTKFPGNPVVTKYYRNGVEINKENTEEMERLKRDCLATEFPKYNENYKASEVFNVKIENVKYLK